MLQYAPCKAFIIVLLEWLTWVEVVRLTIPAASTPPVIYKINNMFTMTRSNVSTLSMDMYKHTSNSCVSDFTVSILVAIEIITFFLFLFFFLKETLRSNEMYEIVSALGYKHQNTKKIVWKCSQDSIFIHCRKRSIVESGHLKSEIPFTYFNFHE